MSTVNDQENVELSKDQRQVLAIVANSSKNSVGLTTNEIAEELEHPCDIKLVIIGLEALKLVRTDPPKGSRRNTVIKVQKPGLDLLGIS